MIDVNSASDNLNELNEAADEVLVKLQQAVQLLAAVKEGFSHVPSDSDLHDLTSELGNACASIAGIREGWEELPSIDDLHEYGKAMACCSPCNDD